MSIKLLPVAFCAAALFVPSLTEAQPASRADAGPVIEVMGHATVTKPAEWASITGVVRAEAKDQQTALRSMSAKQDTISDGLRRLAGAKGLSVEAADLSFAPILPPGCKNDDESDEAVSAPPLKGGGKTCAPTGVLGSVKLTATVKPAEQLGKLASLAVQLGAEDVQMGESGVDDPTALEAQAANAAYEQALAQAKLLAGAANEHLGRLVRLNRGAPEDSAVQGNAFSPHVAMPAADKAEAPDVALKLTPAKVTQNSWVVVTFELVK